MMGLFDTLNASNGAQAQGLGPSADLFPMMGGSTLFPMLAQATTRRGSAIAGPVAQAPTPSDDNGLPRLLNTARSVLGVDKQTGLVGTMMDRADTMDAGDDQRIGQGQDPLSSGQYLGGLLGLNNYGGAWSSLDDQAGTLAQSLFPTTGGPIVGG